MFRFLKVSVSIAIAIVQSTAFAQINHADTPIVLEEVVVTGVRPGPPLWKVTNGEHVLWILPLVNLYPKKMEWESERVERLIAESQAYIAMPYAMHITSTSNPITIVRLLGTYNKTTKLQEGKRLADILPPDLYQRFLRLKALYFPNDKKIDKLTAREAGKRMQRKILAAENLEQLSYANFSSPAVIMNSLHKWLERNTAIRRISTSQVVVDKLKANEVKALGEEMVAAVNSASHREFEVTCFASKVVYFENDFESAKKRANAWAQGDADELIRHAAALKNDLALQSLRGPCRAPSVAAEIGDLERRSREKWLLAAEDALTNNDRTFAVLDINEILSTDGLLAALQKKGYMVEVSR